MDQPRVIPGLRAALAAAIAVLAAAGAARADVMMLPAAKDNTLYESATGSLSNGSGGAFIAGRSGQPVDSRRRGAIAFDVAAGVPAGATINSVTLTLSLFQTSSGPQPIELHRMLADWGEGPSVAPGNGGGGGPASPGDATWIHRFSPDVLWTTPGGEFAAAASASQIVDGLGLYSWSSPDLTADVQAWLDAPATNFGWLLLGDESIGGTTKSFHSRESASIDDRPVLIVDFTAVPAPPALLAVLAGLWRSRRRA